MKFTIAMKFAKRIISTPSRCSDRTLRSCILRLQKYRKRVLSLTKVAGQTLLHSTLNTQYWSSIVKVLILIGARNISQVVETVVPCSNHLIKPLRNVDYSQMPPITLRCLPLTRNFRILNKHSGWTIISRRVCLHREFVGSQISCKVPAHHK